jgi:hypothetical protein
MTTFSLPVTATGPIVRVRIGFSRGKELAIRRSGRAILTPIDVDALIDTGADVSMIESGLLTPFVREGMDLKAIVHVNAPGLGGLALCPQFLTGVRICHPTGNRQQDVLFPAAELVEYALGGPDYQVLIGRDILSRLVFQYDGPAATFSVTY